MVHVLELLQFPFSEPIAMAKDFNLFVASLMLLIGLTNALSTSSKEVIKRSAAKLVIPSPPTKDPFYSAPAGFETAKPGAVLKMRKSALAELVPNCSGAYNILYRTTDSNYNPTWAVTTLFIPDVQSPSSSIKASSKPKLLSVQTPCRYCPICIPHVS